MRKKSNHKRYPKRGNYIQDKKGNTFIVKAINEETDTLKVESVVGKNIFRDVPISEFIFPRGGE